MPNFFAAFTSDVFRPLVTLLIPGTIAWSTWFIGLLWSYPDLKKLVSDNHTESGFLIFLGIIFAGLVIEDLGARWEDWMDEKAGSNHVDNWFLYLRTAFVADPIGRRYTRTLVLRLKFEIGVAFAMISAALGLIWLVFLGFNCGSALIFWLVMTIFTFWGFIEAAATHKVLGRTRAELLKEIRVVTADKTI